MGAGMFDALLTLFVRPFMRPIGRMMMDIFGRTEEVNRLQEQQRAKYV